jgi:hypothetical protein
MRILRTAVQREQLIVAGVAHAEARKGQAHGSHLLARLAFRGLRAKLIHQLLHPLLEQRLDESRLVVEVVVERGRRTPTAIGEPAHGEGVHAVFDQQRLGGIEDRATGFFAILEAALLGGLGPRTWSARSFSSPPTPAG